MTWCLEVAKGTNGSAAEIRLLMCGWDQHETGSV